MREFFQYKPDVDRDRKIFRKLVVIILLLFLAFVVKNTIDSIHMNNIERKYFPIISRFKSYNKLSLKTANGAYLRGKCLTIDEKGNLLDSFYTSLLEKKQSLASKEVGTLIVIEKKRRPLLIMLTRNWILTDWQNNSDTWLQLLTSQYLR